MTEGQPGNGKRKTENEGSEKRKTENKAEGQERDRFPFPVSRFPIERRRR
jgi:hypothetical protein